jgi:hypothetical protein
MPYDGGMPSTATRPAVSNPMAARFSSPGADCNAIAGSVLKKPERAGQLVECLKHQRASVKYGSAKTLRLISEHEPELLYPWFDDFWRMFHGDNTILRWNSIRILGNLAAADRKGKLESVLDRFLAPICGPELIGAANVMAAAARIAAAKPHLADRIAEGILMVGSARYATAECRNVAAGHAIRALEQIFTLLENRPAVMEFVRGQKNNSRPATRTKAEKFLRKWAG